MGGCGKVHRKAGSRAYSGKGEIRDWNNPDPARAKRILSILININ
jgi:hypothetical protein